MRRLGQPVRTGSRRSSSFAPHAAALLTVTLVTAGCSDALVAPPLDAPPIVRSSLGANGRVIIDDAHQGLVSFYDPDKFFGDSRLHRTLLWLVGLWLVFVLGPRRLRGATSAPAPPCCR